MPWRPPRTRPALPPRRARACPRPTCGPCIGSSPCWHGPIPPVARPKTASSSAGCDDLDKAGESWAELVGDDGKSQYPLALQRAREVSAAYATLARAAAETPYLAEWILGRIAPLKGPEDDLQKALAALVVNVRLLAWDLESHLADGSWPTELSKLARNVNDLRKQLGDKYQAECNRLANAGGNRETLHAIHAVLAVPLATGEVRVRLLKEFREIAGRGAGSLGGPSENQPRSADAETVWLARQRGWKTDPALALVDPANAEKRPASESIWEKPGNSAAGREKLADLAKAGEQVRRDLGKITEMIANLAGQGQVDAEIARNPDDGAAARANCSRADRLVRATAPLLAASPVAKVPNAAAGLCRVDVHQFLRWQAQRTMDDFWGPTPAPAGPPPAEGGPGGPYFKTVAKEYLKAAEDLARDATLRRETALLETRGAGAKAMDLSTDKKTYLFDKESDSPVKGTAAVSMSDGMPSGSAAVYLQSKLGEFPMGASQSPHASGRTGLPIGKDATLLFSIAAGDADKARDWRATLFYRGHVRPCQFETLPLPSGPELVWSAPAARTPALPPMANR